MKNDLKRFHINVPTIVIKLHYNLSRSTFYRKMVKNKMKGNCRSLLKQFCMEGTVLGLKYFYIYPDKISRCFWAVTLALLVAFACSLTWLLYLRFDAMPTRITIENQYEPLTSLPFPAITICSPNQLTMSSMIHFNKTLIDGNTTVNLDDALPQLLGFYERISNSKFDIKEMGRLQRLIDDNRYTVPEVMGLLPQSCDRFLKLCVFKGKVFPCRELFRPILTKQGLCCAFNSLYYFKDKRRNVKDHQFKPHMAGTLGLHSPLTVVVDYEPEDALPKTLFHVGAIQIMFTDWTEFPSDDETHLVYPSTEAYLVIHGTYTYCSDEVSSLPPWSRDCLFDHERHLHMFGGYHNTDCDHLCHIRAVEHRCHCQPVYVPHVTSRACEATKIRCITEVTDLSGHGDMDCDCPRDCVSRMYAVNLNVGNLRGLEYMISNPYAHIKFNETTTILHFFFPSSVYVKKKQETVMSLISLASNLGGIFGLCMGVSVVTVVELVFYTSKAVQNWLRKRLRSALVHQIQRYRPRE